jgi:hypothetical protein
MPSIDIFEERTFGYFFHGKCTSYVTFLCIDCAQKMVCAASWAIFSPTHLVTLLPKVTRRVWAKIVQNVAQSNFCQNKTMTFFHGKK